MREGVDGSIRTLNVLFFRMENQQTGMKNKRLKYIKVKIPKELQRETYKRVTSEERNWQ